MGNGNGLNESRHAVTQNGLGLQHLLTIFIPCAHVLANKISVPQHAMHVKTGVNFTETTRCYAKALVEAVAYYSSIHHPKLIEFHKHTLWQALPQQTRDYLLDHPDQIVDLRSSSTHFPNWPECLQEFVTKCESLSLDRTPVDYEYCTEKEDTPHKKYLSQYMSSKKKHEVIAFSRSVAKASEICLGRPKTTTIFDAGAGKGYLSRFLSFSQKYNVIAIDASLRNTDGGVKQTTKLSQTLSKINNELMAEETEQQKVHHVHSFIGEDTDLIKIMEDTCSISYNEDDSRIGVVGLHCCGDLTPTLLRLFAANEKVNSLTVVPCCYYAMKERRDPPTDETCSGELRNFPMSAFVRSIGEGAVTEGGLKVACDNGEHAHQNPEILEAIRLGIQDSELSALFRMLLDKLISEGTGDLCSCSVTVPKLRLKEDATFLFYCRRTVPKIKIKRIKEIGALEDSFFINYYHQQIEQKIHLRLAAVVQLRRLVSSLIESLILVDRVLFLKEEEEKRCGEYSVQLLPIFHQHISPRNMPEFLHLLFLVQSPYGKKMEEDVHKRYSALCLELTTWKKDQ